jgi:hypothetical protein
LYYVAKSKYHGEKIHAEFHVEFKTFGTSWHAKPSSKCKETKDPYINPKKFLHLADMVKLYLMVMGRFVILRLRISPQFPPSHSLHNLRI